jgi:hypothetical protein
MTVVQRITGSCRITGDLTVDGNMPTYNRANLAQDALKPYPLPFTDWRVWDALHTNLPGTPATDDLGLEGGTFGTDGPVLSTGDAKAATVTRRARAQVRLPAEYDDGETVRLRVAAGMKTTIADTSATVDLEAHKLDEEGAVGADICATAAQDVNSLTNATFDFTITPAGLSAGDILDLRLTLAVVDAATGTAVIAQVTAVKLLCDVKG